jgi:hypothetical protein
MDFDFLNRRFLQTARTAVQGFRQAVEASTPAETDVETILERVRPYQHTTRLDEEFVIGAIDGSGEYPLIQQDDVFMHFLSAARTCYATASGRQHKMSACGDGNELFATLVNLQDDIKAIRQTYQSLIQELIGLDLKALVSGSDYVDVFQQFGRGKITTSSVTWPNVALARASQVATHGYLIRSIGEIGMGIRLLEQKPKYLLLDTTLGYFLLGESIYLPELLKRYLITQAKESGTCVLGLSKSHNIPNGDLIGRLVKEKLEHTEHWYLRLPSPDFGEKPWKFLSDREVPPKLGVTYLFKFHSTSFPMRLDVDAGWWRKHIGGDEAKERRLFQDLDFTCHDVRSYGYPYPLQAAHRRSALTKQERKAVKDIVLQNAQSEGMLRGAFLGERDAEGVHMQGY